MLFYRWLNERKMHESRLLPFITINIEKRDIVRPGKLDILSIITTQDDVVKF